MRLRSACVGLIFVLTSLATAQDVAQSVQLAGKIDSVTVYRGQALVARLVEVPAPGGLREVVVTDLPVQIVPSSVFAESADGAEVRSVLFRERAVEQDVREDVRKFDQQIREVQDAQTANQRSLQVLAEQKAFLDHLQGFVAPTAQMEMSRGVLNAETLKNLTTFQFEQRAAIASNELKLAKETRDLAEKLATLNRQRNELTGASGKTVREVVVFANFPANGGKLRVRYLVNAATWSPSYNVRGDRNNKQVTVEYNASVQQQSGEDWSDVQMTLSTATPSLVAMGPTLEPLAISLAAMPRGAVEGAAAGYQEQKQEIEQRKLQINTLRNSVGNTSFNADQLSIAGNPSLSITGGTTQVGAKELDRGLNDLARDMQVLEFRAKDVRDNVRKPLAANETVSVTYQLSNRTSLPSRRDMQLIQVASLPMPAESYKLAAPVLSSYVYDQATLTNHSKMVLLAGPVASYLGGEFVGGGEIPTVAVGETFGVGFGIDSSLRATRELVDKTESIQGGNKVLNFSYRLSIENFGAAPAAVRLTDRMPITKEKDITISLVSPSMEQTEVPNQPRDQKKGILRWDLTVPPQAIEEKAAEVKYQLKLEFDRQMAITGMPVSAK